MNDGTAEVEIGPDLRDAVLPLVQPQGAVLVFERPSFTLVQASESLPRVLHRELPASFGASVETILDPIMGARVRSLTENAEERRCQPILGKLFETRLLNIGWGVLVELMPTSQSGDPAQLGDRLDRAASEIAHAATLADLGRIVSQSLQEATGFAKASLVRIIEGGKLQVLAEAAAPRPESGKSAPIVLASLSSRPAALEAIARLARTNSPRFVADTMAAGVRLLSISATYDEATAIARAELAASPAPELALLAADGVVTLAIVPVASDAEIWGHLVLESPETADFGHDRRRFALTLGQIVAEAADRLQLQAQQRAERLAPELAAAFLATVGDDTNPVEALLLGDRLLATAVGADGVAILSEGDCAIVGPAPDPDSLLAKLPLLLDGDTATLMTRDLRDCGLFTAAELAGTAGMVAIRLARRPFIALAGFRSTRSNERLATGWNWEPPLVEAFYAIGQIFRRMLLLGDDAASAELSSQIAEMGERVFGPGKLRTVIMAASASGMALVAGNEATSVQLVESNLMFRRLFGLEAREKVSGTLDIVAQRLQLKPTYLVDAGQATTEVELWSSELGPRIIEIDTRSIVRTRSAGERNDLTLLQVTDVSRIRRQEVAMRMARDQALALIRTREELLANMSHELRTPLNAVIGFAEMIAQETLGPIGNPRYATYGLDIEKAGRHLLALINDVLDLSRLSSARHPLTEEVVDPTALLRSCVDWAKAASKQRDISLETDIDPGGFALRCDERALRQVVINLVSNAIKFTPERGRVVVRLRWHAPDEDVIIEVADDGIGMSASEVSRAFEPFFRGGGAYQRRIEGAGLGLAIAKGLTELHGGALVLLSSEGQGTTVRLELPAWRVVLPEPPDVTAGDGLVGEPG